MGNGMRKQLVIKNQLIAVMFYSYILYNNFYFEINLDFFLIFLIGASKWPVMVDPRIGYPNRTEGLRR